MKRGYFYVIGFGTFLAFDTLTQISTKFASRQAGEFMLRWEWLLVVSHNPWLYVAIAGYLGSFVAWMTLLKRAPVGPAFAASHLGLVPVLALSAVIFGEELTVTQITGAICIVLGIVFLSFGADTTKQHDESWVGTR
jgi:drug/metabolite transporter (DMT)-like permease